METTMRKLLTLWIALAAVAFVTVSTPAHAFGCRGWAQPASSNGCNSSIAAGAPAFTKWNSGDEVNTTLSGGNLVATITTAGSVYAGVRAIASHSTGKFYYELTMTNLTSSIQFGVGNAAAAIGGANDFIGNDNNAISVNYPGNVLMNNASQGTVGGYASGDVVSVAVDIANALIWWRTNAGNWNNIAGGDPTNSSTGHGIPFSGMAAGPYFPIVSILSTANAVTANFGASAYAQSVPTGYVNW
jgi:hypothetical protein